MYKKPITHIKDMSKILQGARYKSAIDERIYTIREAYVGLTKLTGEIRETPPSGIFVDLDFEDGTREERVKIHELMYDKPLRRLKNTKN